MVMTEANTTIETSPEQNQSYWYDVKELLDNDDPRRKNDGVMELLLNLSFEDTETTLCYPVRVCAVCTLANVLEHIQRDPKQEYAGIYAEAALAIENKAYDKEEHVRVRFSAKDAFRKYLKGSKNGIFK